MPKKNIAKEEGMMEEGLTVLQQMEARLGWLSDLLEDGEAPLSDKVDGLLTVLGEVRNERAHETQPMQDTIARQRDIMSIVARPYKEAEEDIKGDMWRILEEFYADERHDSEVGRAQIVRPKARIVYDIKGLETLRLSSDEVERMIGHLRDESPSKPYLKVKLK